jgi:hypothetical protein
MEHGNPFANSWFEFFGGGSGSTGANFTDLPPTNGGSASLQTSWAGPGSGYWGGFGRTNPMDISGQTHFSFWINPDANQNYDLQLNIQEDDNGDGNVNPASDDEFQYVCTVSPTGPCAVSGGGWQLVEIPLSSFTRDTSYLYGGNGILDTVPTGQGGNGQLINVVVAIINNSGSNVSFRTDYWKFENQNAQIAAVIDIQDTDLHPHHDGSPAAVAGLNDVIEVVVYGASTAVGDPEDLDTDLIDTSSLQFGPGMGGISGSHAQEFNLDVNADGLDDARFRFLTGDAAFDKSGCTDTEGTLTGELTTGESFAGTDSIVTDCNAICH